MNFIFHILGIIIIPTAEVIFFRGVGNTTNQMPLKFPLDPIKPPLKIPLNHHSS
jgi:hypothetical protein